MGFVKNSKIIRVLCAIFLLFLTLTLNASNLKLKVLIDKAEIREEPNISSSIIAKVPIEAVLESTGKSGEWYKVSFKYKGKFTISGYIHQSFVRAIEKVPERKESEKKEPEKKIEEKPEALPVSKEIPIEKKKTPHLTPESENKLKSEEFFTVKNKLMTSFNEKKSDLLKKKINMNKQLEEDNKKIESLNNKITVSRGNRFFIDAALNFLAAIFFPGLKFSVIQFFTSNILLLIFFPVFMFNLLLYLIVREKTYYKKKKILILLIFFLILFFFFSPTIFGSEEEKSEIKTKLDTVNELLEMSLTEKAIFKLEYKLEKKSIGLITIPQIVVDNSYLKPFEEVYIYRPEYYFTLGSLYFEIGKKGKAVDELKKIFEFDFIRYRRYEKKYQKLLISLSKFFIEEGMIKASSQAIDKLITIGQNITTLIDFSDYLYQKMMHDSSKKVIDRAIKVSKHYHELIKLSGYLLKRGMINEAYSAAERAIFSTRELNTLKEIIGFTIDKKMFNQLNTAIERYISFCRKTKDFLNLSNFLYRKQMIENASKVINVAILNSWNIKSLTEISRFALKKKNYELAISAIEKCFKISNKSWTYPINSPMILEISKYIPTEEQITLPVYLGIIQQKVGFFEKAKVSYETGGGIEFSKVIDSFGFEIKGNLNNLFYLKQFWVLNKEFDKLKNLKPFYSLLEEKYLNFLENKNNKEIVQLEEKIKNLNQDHEKKTNSIIELYNNVFQENSKLSLHIMRLIAFIILMILVTVVVIIKSIQAARKVSVYKFFAFAGKFISVSGWLSIFAVINLPLGIVMVLIGQAMQIFQKIQQDREKNKVYKKENVK